MKPKKRGICVACGAAHDEDVACPPNEDGMESGNLQKEKKEKKQKCPSCGFSGHTKENCLSPMDQQRFLNHWAWEAKIR